MGSRKPIYRIKSTGQLVIGVEVNIKVIPPPSQENFVFELLNEYGERTGSIVSVSRDDFEIAS